MKNSLWITCIFYEKLVYELHAWIENHPTAIHSPNVSDSLFVKTNGTIAKNKKHILQISVQELHNDMILPISQRDFFCARTFDGKLGIVDKSLRKYIPEYL